MQLLNEELTTKTCPKCYSKNEHLAAECHICQHPFPTKPKSDLVESNSDESDSNEPDLAESNSDEFDSNESDLVESNSDESNSNEPDLVESNSDESNSNEPDLAKSDLVQLISTEPSSIESNLAQVVSNKSNLIESNSTESSSHESNSTESSSHESNSTESNFHKSNSAQLNFNLRLISENLQKLKQLNFKIFQEIQNPSLFGGLAVLVFAVVLWINYFISRQINANQPIALESENKIEEVKNVPEGLYSYGGAAYFAPLVTYGINDAIFAAHPQFKMRYSKPRNLHSNYADGISMLLDGELSFAFNNRPLTEKEYALASVRGIKLKQVPVALDGVVFFVNNGVTVSQIRLDEVQAIFSGKITNWSQLGGEDLPIVPLVLSPEDLATLGVANDSAENTQYAENHTQILRQVISIPGAISFASSSLIANQSSVKSLSLAAPQSDNFVSPFNGDKEPNLKLFKNGSYPLTRRLFVVIRQDDTLDEQAGFAYGNFLLSDEGQAIVEAAGLVPLR